MRIEGHALDAILGFRRLPKRTKRKSAFQKRWGISDVKGSSFETKSVWALLSYRYLIHSSFLPRLPLLSYVLNAD
jgi:hypothetical protein